MTAKSARRRGVLRDERGFTLIELLVAMTLLAMMTAMLFGSFRFGTRAWEASDARIEAADRVEAVQNLLRRELAQAMLSHLVEAPPNGPLPPTFLGEADELRFLAPLPTHQGIGGLYLFRLRLDRARIPGDLLLEWRIYRPDVAITDGGNPDGAALLLADVADLAVSYYGRADPDAIAAWTASWSGGERLPELLRLEIEFPSGDRRYWPALVIAPMLAGS